MSRRKPKPATEWEMAMIAAGYFWLGTSITEGALVMLEKMRADGQSEGESK